MIEYADIPACLRGTILRYFGDPAARERCDSWGNCRPDAIDAYERKLVRKILAGIARAGERYGRHRIVAMLRGDTTDLPPALAALSTTGLLREQTPDGLNGWLDASISAELVVVSKDQYRTLSLTEAGREVMRGRMQEVIIRRPFRQRRELVTFRPLEQETACQPWRTQTLTGVSEGWRSCLNMSKKPMI